jgi:PHD/YefM family antitoxin component YafN of YafNO toxin-antitoxin module
MTDREGKLIMSDAHQTMDVQRAGRDLEHLHARVAAVWGRVEITREGGDSCVLLSKAELQTIERALEILCELPGGKKVCEEIGRVAEQSVASFRDRAGAKSTIPGVLIDGDGAGSSASL